MKDSQGENLYPVIYGKVLYDNPSGTQDEITLNDNWSNYSFMDVFWKMTEWDEGDANYPTMSGICRIPVVAYSWMQVGCTSNNNRWSYIGWNYTCVRFSGTNKLQQPYKANAHMYQGSSNNYTRSNSIKIIKVIGYK